MNAISSPDDPRHGSSAGCKAHTRDKVPVCDACRAWKKAYDAERWGRSSKAEAAARQAAARKAVIEKAATEDVDWVVVHRIVREGQRCPANTAERLEVVRQWIARGGEGRALRTLTGWNVERYLRAIREHEANADEVAA